MGKRKTNKLISNIIKDNMMDYSAYVLLNRALPSLEDGLKPVHRRILYSMWKDRAFKFTKCANINGYVMQYHPHGDSYPTLVKLAQKDRHNTPLIEGKGNFGQATSRDLDYGAMRYTEAKLTPLAIDSMQNFEKDIVDFVPNYDGTKTMPKHLPVKHPNILTMENDGIGVGMSSSFAPFNSIEVCEATEKYALTGEHTNLYFDFATGGTLIASDEEIEKINKTGQGQVTIRAKINILKKTAFEITEIPFNTTREAIIKRISDLARDKKVEVSDVKDLTGLKGQKILVVVKRGADIEKVIQKLYKLSPLQTNYSANMNLLVDGLPKVLGVHEIIERWLKWRAECIKRGIRFDIQQMKKKLNILYGLQKILVDLDRAIQIIRFEEEDKIDSTLMSTFGISEEQAREVSKMRLRDISKQNIEKKILEIQELEQKITIWEYSLTDEKQITNTIVNGLRTTAEKHGKARMTIIQK